MAWKRALLAAVAAAATITLAAAEGPVAYTKSAFQAAVGTNAPLFVKFYAPWCGHCKAMAPAWDQLGAKYNGGGKITIGKVDCTVEPEVCSAQGVTGYPTVKYIVGSKEEEYEGGRSIEALSKFVDEKLGATASAAPPAAAGEAAEIQIEKGLYIATGDNFQSVVNVPAAFVKFYAPWCGHCKRLAPTWDELAAAYEGNTNVRIVKVDCTQHSQVCQDHGVRGYPTLALFKNGKKEVPYSGARTMDAFKTFLSEHAPAGGAAATEEAAEAEEAAATDGDAAAAGGVEVVEGLKILTDDTFKAGVAKGTTFVKFYAPWCGHCKRLAPTWDALAKKFEGNKDISVAKVDCTVHSTTCSSFEVRGYPTLLLFKNGEKKEKYSGSRDEQALSDWLVKQAQGHDEL